MNINQTEQDKEAEKLLLNLHNLCLGDNPNFADVKSELRDLDSETLDVIKRSLSYVTKLVDAEIKRKL